MGSRVKVSYQGREVTGEKLDFKIEQEEWNIYTLEDGTRFKMRSVLAEVVRLEDEFNAQGDPVYLANSQNIVSADVPERLKKDAKGTDKIN